LYCCTTTTGRVSILHTPYKVLEYDVQGTYPTPRVLTKVTGQVQFYDHWVFSSGQQLSAQSLQLPHNGETTLLVVLLPLLYHVQYQVLSTMYDVLPIRSTVDLR
jgi:hypothetical protein